jgi:hypothetical protein
MADGRNNGMEHWWNDTDRDKPMYWEKNLSWYYSALQRYAIRCDINLSTSRRNLEAVPGSSEMSIIFYQINLRHTPEYFIITF